SPSASAPNPPSAFTSDWASRLGALNPRRLRPMGTLTAKSTWWSSSTCLDPSIHCCKARPQLSRTALPSPTAAVHDRLLRVEPPYPCPPSPTTGIHHAHPHHRRHRRQPPQRVFQ